MESGSNLEIHDENNPPQSSSLKRKVYDIIKEVCIEIEAEMKALDDKRTEWYAIVDRVAASAAVAPKKIKLEIGGVKFTTLKDNLLRFDNSFFHAMIGSGHWLPDDDNVYFIDRDPAKFHYVMEFMRSGNTSFLHLLSGLALSDVKDEFDYYQIPFPGVVNTWNTQICNQNISYSDLNSRLATRKNATSLLETTNCISEGTGARFLVEIVNLGGADDNHRAQIVIGFIERDAFREYDFNGHLDKSYCLLTSNGTVCGGGGGVRAYTSPIRNGQVVECVHDVINRTISFSVDGVNKGVAYTNVPASSFHCTCSLLDSCAQVRLLL